MVRYTALQAANDEHLEPKFLEISDKEICTVFSVGSGNYQGILAELPQSDFNIPSFTRGVKDVQQLVSFGHILQFADGNNVVIFCSSTYSTKYSSSVGFSVRMNPKKRFQSTVHNPNTRAR